MADGMSKWYCPTHELSLPNATCPKCKAGDTNPQPDAAEVMTAADGLLDRLESMVGEESLLSEHPEARAALAQFIAHHRANDLAKIAELERRAPGFVNQPIADTGDYSAVCSVCHANIDDLKEDELHTAAQCVEQAQDDTELANAIELDCALGNGNGDGPTMIWSEAIEHARQLRTTNAEQAQRIADLERELAELNHLLQLARSGAYP